MNCTQLDELLLDGSEAATERASSHAASCSACAATLEDWSEIASTARQLRTTWHSDLLLPRIQREIGKGESPSRRLLRTAAVLLLSVGIGATAFHAVRVQTRDARYDESILRIAAVDEVERAEREYVAAIERMQQLADAKLEEPQTPLMISYKEKLMLLDDAIAECEANVERNRQNAHLRNQLLAMYSEKRHTLREILREDTHEEAR